MDDNHVCCEDCKYFDEISQGDQGECHRNAPAVFITPGGEPCYATWPKVLADEWCGEFKRRIK